MSRAEGAALPRRRRRRCTVALDWDDAPPATCACTPRCICCAAWSSFPSPAARSAPTRAGSTSTSPTRPAIDKDKLTADLNALIAADHPVSERWITDAELEANPGLVRTMSVKPPTGSGQVRLVASARTAPSTCSPAAARMSRATGEIGAVAVTKIEKKGKLNRRIRVAFA